jgi:hypothetical protein
MWRPGFPLKVFTDGSVIEDGEGSDLGILGLSSQERTMGLLALVLRLHPGYQLLSETLQPGVGQLLGRPGGLAEEATQDAEGADTSNSTEQPSEGATFWRQDEPQQHGDEVLELGQGEGLTEGLSVLAQSYLQAYDRYGHGSWPPQGLFSPQGWPREPCPSTP